jgi:tripartite-type tricarboxylate transporter receptor subunit TctC
MSAIVDPRSGPESIDRRHARARLFRVAAVLAAALACAPVIAQVAAYPVKPVHLVIPFPPGGSVDNLARAMASELTRLWGQAVVVDGKPGAGGVTAAAAVAHSAPDGYTIFLTDEAPLTITPLMQRNLPYDPKDLAPAIALVRPRIVVVAGNSPVNTIPD